MKTFRMLEFECDFTEEMYGETREEALQRHAIDQQYEVGGPCLVQEDNGEWQMYWVDVVVYPEKYRALKMDVPIVKFVVEDDGKSF